MRVETLRPFPGTEQLLTNITSLRHGGRFGTGVRWLNGSVLRAGTSSRVLIAVHRSCSQPRIRGNESWDITGGSHPICRQLPMFGQQRSSPSEGLWFKAWLNHVKPLQSPMFISHTAGYADLFAWAANPSISEYKGKHVIAGRVCSLWNLRSKILGSISSTGTNVRKHGDDGAAIC